MRGSRSCGVTWPAESAEDAERRAGAGASDARPASGPTPLSQRSGSVDGCQGSTATVRAFTFVTCRPNTPEESHPMPHPDLSRLRHSQLIPSVMARISAHPNFTIPRSWVSILRRLTRWGPNLEPPLVQSETPRQPGSNSIDVSSVDEHSVEEGSAEDFSAADASVGRLVGEGSVGEGSVGEGSVGEGSVGEGLVGAGSVGEGSLDEGRLAGGENSTEAARLAAGTATAMAAAVRRQLTTPGSVPPGEQLSLLLADRRSHQLCGSTPPRAKGVGRHRHPRPVLVEREH